MIPTQLKRLKGTLQKCRENPNEPQPGEPLGNAPAYFTETEQKIWREIKRMIVPGVLTVQDRFVVELLCQLMARLRQRDPPMTGAERSNLTYCLSQLGLTPCSRSKISVEPQSEKSDPFAEFRLN
jgi:phage terminase small subunit